MLRRGRDGVEVRFMVSTTLDFCNLFADNVEAPKLMIHGDGIHLHTVSPRGVQIDGSIAWEEPIPFFIVPFNLIVLAIFKVRADRAERRNGKHFGTIHICAIIRQLKFAENMYLLPSRSEPPRGCTSGMLCIHIKLIALVKSTRHIVIQSRENCLREKVSGSFIAAMKTIIQCVITFCV